MTIEQEFAAALASGMLQIYQNIDAEKIKSEVDGRGLDHFIHVCALEAGATGAIAGLGGFVTTVVGVPASVLNTVVQQFRVTMAVIYSKRGTVKPSFHDFAAIVGMSLGVEVGVTIGAELTGAIAEQILIRLGAAEAGMMFPLAGAVIGGGANYGFIRSIGGALKHIDMSKA